LEVRFKVNNDILGNSSPSDSNNSTDSGRIFSTVTLEMEVTETMLAKIYSIDFVSCQVFTVADFLLGYRFLNP
jgi:hypothetical protein